MKTSDFDFSLPPELIAQTPLPERDASRLMVVGRGGARREHRRFSELPALLNPGDCLILNDTRVLPARLFGVTESRARVEALLLKDKGDNVWECLTKPGRRTQPGTQISFGDGRLCGVVERVLDEGLRHVRFAYEGVFLALLDAFGQVPLPPYIKTSLSDKERYQTVYARAPGSAAAPTAGLHFTPALLDAIRRGGVQTAAVTLHVGLGTFRPVKEEDIEKHVMHAEYAEIPEETARVIEETRARGGRVIAVGTTVCRTLESFAREDGRVTARAGFTNIFIRPGYRFRCVDALITNFHLPRSTLLMLVSALAGRETVIGAYEEAIRHGYRFFSFGDAMLIV